MQKNKNLNSEIQQDDNLKINKKIKNQIIIASRLSPLAMWQTEFVEQEIKKHHPNTSTDILGMSTKGDEILDQHLSKIGGKGLFTKALEEAIYQQKADCAVHSLKDLPMELPVLEEAFAIAAVLARHNPRDAFVSKQYQTIEALPAGAIIGTSSLRRVAFLQQYYPHLKTALLRGNINTRIQKLKAGEYHAIILAAAGLDRLANTLDLTDIHVQHLPIEKFIPAPTQGALAIEVYGETHLEFFKPLNHRPTFLAAMAERQISRSLGGSCQVPLAAYAEWQNLEVLEDINDIENINLNLKLIATLFDENFKNAYTESILTISLAEYQSPQAQKIIEDFASKLAQELADQFK